jgi:hypothetical protein
MRSPASATPNLADAIQIDGHNCGRRSVNARRRLHAAFVPEERLGHGALPRLRLSENVVLTHHGTGEGIVTTGIVALRRGPGHRRPRDRCLRHAEGNNRSRGKFVVRRKPPEVHRRSRVRPQAAVLGVCQPTGGSGCRGRDHHPPSAGARRARHDPRGDRSLDGRRTLGERTGKGQLCALNSSAGRSNRRAWRCSRR